MAGPTEEAVVPESQRAGEDRQGQEGDLGEGGSSAGDEVPMPHNLDMHRSGSREDAVTVMVQRRGRWRWRRGRQRCRGRRRGWREKLDSLTARKHFYRDYGFVSGGAGMLLPLYPICYWYRLT
jgi:hypothetical protein